MKHAFVLLIGNLGGRQASSDYRTQRIVRKLGFPPPPRGVVSIGIGVEL